MCEQLSLPHVHRWRCESQLVQDVPAVCRLCGEERVFQGQRAWKYGEVLTYGRDWREVERDVTRGIQWLGFSEGIAR